MSTVEKSPMKKSMGKFVVKKAKHMSSDDWNGPTWLKLFQTFNINMSCVALGLVVSLTGPTLIDLSEIFRVSIETVSYIGVVIDIGAVIGPLFADMVYRRVNAQIVAIACGLGVSVTNVLMPLSRDVDLAYALGFFNGMAYGLMEVGTYVWLVGLWNGSRPILQLYSLMFGVGALFAPLIAKPFLSGDRILGNASQILLNDTVLNAPIIAESRVVIPFGIIGGFGGIIAILMLSSYCIDSTDIRPQKKEEDVKTFPFYEWLMTFLVSVYHLFVVLSEASFTRFIVVYAIRVNSMAKGDAAVLSSVFWIGFTVIRVIIIPVSIKLRSAAIVIMGQVVLMTACFVLYNFSHEDQYLWVGAALYGCGMGPLYGGSLAWLTEHVTLRHAYLSLILVMTCFGSVLATPIVAPYIESTPQVLINTLSISSMILALVLVVMLLCARYVPNTRGNSEKKLEIVSTRFGVDNMGIQISDEIMGGCTMGE